jgi:hypothetical protein
MVLSDARAALDGPDPVTNLFAGDRAALACDVALNAALPANVIPVGDLTFWAGRTGGMPASALQTAAE